MDASSLDFAEDLLRFALLRTGNRRAAFELVQCAVVEGEVAAGQLRTRRHLFLWAARFVADRMESLPPSLPGVEDLPPELDSVLRACPPRLWSAVALYCVVDLKPNELAQVVRMRPKETRLAIAEAKKRLALAGLSEDQCRERLRHITFSEEERLLVESAPPPTIRRRFGAERALGVAAVCLGVFMTLGWVAWERWRESEPVQMRAQMQRILEASGVSGPAGIEKFDGKAAETPDWLFLHGMDVQEIPESFSALQLASARLLDFNGGKMAQFTIEEPQGLLSVAPAEALGLGGERAAAGRTSLGEWSGAWAVAGPYAFFLAVKDADARLDELLKGQIAGQ
jgi:hypothetical protein